MFRGAFFCFALLSFTCWILRFKGDIASWSFEEKGHLIGVVTGVGGRF